MSSDLPLDIRTDRADYSPGETVEVVITAGPADKDLALGEVLVKLGHELEYDYSISADERSLSRTLKEPTTAAEERVSVDGTLAAGETAKWHLSFPVPDSPPGSAAGEIVTSRWFVAAHTPTTPGIDARSEAEIRVYIPRPAKADWPPRQGGYEDHRAKLELSLAKTEGRPGDQLTGTFSVRPQESFGCTGIRVELEGHERVDLGDGKDWYVEGPRVELAPASKLEPGHDLELAFSLELPADMTPTFETDAGSITCLVRAIVARRLRRDLTVEQPIYVYDYS